MKATTATLAAMMAAGALAQPHHPRHVHQQHHRDLHARDVTETVWTTEWVTEYVTVDATTTMSGSPGVLIETTSTTSSSSSSSSTTSTTSSTSTEPPKPEKSTSTTPPPEPTTTKEKVVEPTPSPEAPADTGSKDKGANTGGGIGAAEYSGFITYYDVGLGACGWNDAGRQPTGSINDPMIVAISRNVYFAGIANPNNMPLCGKKIAMESPDNPGVVAYGIISDACEACTTAGDLDVNSVGMENFYPGSVVAKGKGRISWKIL